jgi:hypothetical protein
MKIMIVLAVVMLECQPLVLAGTPPEYLQSFDPEKGFKPAQKDLTEIFLQIAGSLEFYGSPEPYLRHMANEHTRIETIYQKKYGKAGKSFRPAQITDQYIDTLSSSWKFVSPKFGLDVFAKEIGDAMRDGIQGTRGTGTIVVEIFNEHQSLAFEAMAGKGNQPADFDALKAKLVTGLELDKARVDDRNYPVPRRDAVRSAIIIRGIISELYQRIDDSLKPADAERVKTVLTNIILSVGEMAHSELEVGLAQWAIEKSSTAAN